MIHDLYDYTQRQECQHYNNKFVLLKLEFSKVKKAGTTKDSDNHSFQTNYIFSCRFLNTN